MDRSKCVECGSHVPPYLNFMCEDCWRVALNEKLDNLGQQEEEEENK